MEKVYSCVKESYVLSDLTTKKEQSEKEIFAAILAHGLKTPTIAQIRSLELLLSGALGSFTKEKKDMLINTLESCKYMYSMINNILSAYKYEKNDRILINKSFDFYTLVKDCCIKLSRYASAKKQNISLESHVKNPIINADEMQIKHAVKNIIIESLSRGYSNTQISVKIGKEKNNIIFAVENKSPYIPTDIINKVFEKSPQGAAKFNKIGSNLRLYLARRIIAAHGGLMFASSVDNSCTFGFRVPYFKK